MSNTWKRTRNGYVSYRSTKRRLGNLWKEHDQTYRRMKKALTHLMHANAKAFSKLGDVSESQNTQEAMTHFQEAVKTHEAVCDQITETLKAFRQKEIPYSILIFNNLMNKHNLSMADLAEAFGVYNSRIFEWLRSEKHEDVEASFAKEFGSCEVKKKDN